MKPKLLYLFGIIFIISGVAGIVNSTSPFVLSELLAMLFTIILGAFMLNRARKTPQTPKKPKKQTYSFDCDVKGHFLHDRQRVLAKLYNDNYDREIDRNDETLVTDYIIFADEPDNEHDPDAIAILTKSKDQIGYIPRDQTATFRQTIDRDLPYTTYLTIYKRPDEYFAEIQVQQKR